MSHSQTVLIVVSLKCANGTFQFCDCFFVFLFGQSHQTDIGICKSDQPFVADSQCGFSRLVKEVVRIVVIEDLELRFSDLALIMCNLWKIIRFLGKLQCDEVFRNRKFYLSEKIIDHRLHIHTFRHQRFVGRTARILNGSLSKIQ
ncbi:hypothetical protein D3C80_1483860 [compost metagenome]